MKIQLELLIVASLFAYAYAKMKTCREYDWFAYKEKYNKVYKSADEDLLHYDTFCDNIGRINHHNDEYIRGEVNHELKVDKFTDLTSEEVNILLKDRRAKRKRPTTRQPPLADEYDDID